MNILVISFTILTLLNTGMIGLLIARVRQLASPRPSGLGEYNGPPIGESLVPTLFSSCGARKLARGC